MAMKLHLQLSEVCLVLWEAQLYFGYFLNNQNLIVKVKAVPSIDTKRGIQKLVRHTCLIYDLY